MSEREDWINLIRNEYDPMPDLGRANYSAFESGWDDGAGRIADAIIANKTLLLRRRSEDASSPSSSMTIEALADKLEAVSSLGGYIMESKEAAQIVTALRSISSLSAATEASQHLAMAVDAMIPFMAERDMEGENAFEIATLNLWKQLAKYRAATDRVG
jgi:hypothetical protein